jgi:ferritin-like metal-binding protein YciE
MATTQKRKKTTSKTGASQKKSGSGRKRSVNNSSRKSAASSRGKSRTRSIARSKNLGNKVMKSVKAIFESNDEEKTIKDLFKEAVKDMYSAETQLVEALEKMGEAAESGKLKKAFKKHLSQTKKHAQRLEATMKQMGTDPGNKTCKAMEGLIEEGEEVIKNFDNGAVRDAGLIMAAQKVEHYEIASYGTLCEMAEGLGLTRIYSSLSQILEEEKETDELLTEIAMEVNEEAMQD